MGISRCGWLSECGKAQHTHVGFRPGHYAFDRAQDVLVLLEHIEYAGLFGLSYN